MSVKDPLYLMRPEIFNDFDRVTGGLIEVDNGLANVRCGVQDYIEQSKKERELLEKLYGYIAKRYTVHEIRKFDKLGHIFDILDEIKEHLKRSSTS